MRIETSPTKQIFLEMWREKMSASARLQVLTRENEECKTKPRVIEPAARIEISRKAREKLFNE